MIYSGMLHSRVKVRVVRGPWGVERLLIQCTYLLLFMTACAASVARPAPMPRLQVDQVLGSGMVPAGMLVEPGGGVRPLVRAIDRAQRSVFLEIYILSDARIMHALERAAAQGVAVYVLLEPHPYGLATQPLSIAQRLRSAGIHVRWSRPGFVYTHAKFLVLDDALAIVSTANFSRSAFTRNREILLFDHLPHEVRVLSALFRADWDRTSAHFDDSNLVVSPDNSRFKLTRLIARARRAVDIYAEEIADGASERLLARLHARGIRVRVLLPNATTPGARWLETHGVQVRALASPYVHAKAVIVDGREAFVGSENVSTTSLDHNREVGILVRGADVAALERVFSHDWSSHE